MLEELIKYFIEQFEKQEKESGWKYLEFSQDRQFVSNSPKQDLQLAWHLPQVKFESILK